MLKQPTFGEAFAFFLGLWLAAASAYGIAWSARRGAVEFPAKFSAESVAGFQAIFFARTRQAFPASGTEQEVDGVRWRVRYTGNSGEPGRVVVEAESTPEKHAAAYAFERRIP